MFDVFDVFDLICRNYSLIDKFKNKIKHRVIISIYTLAKRFVVLRSIDCARLASASLRRNLNHDLTSFIVKIPVVAEGWFAVILIANNYNLLASVSVVA